MALRYNSPPGWPIPPRDWVPPADWRPDPAWPPVPEGWQFWVPDNPPPAKQATAKWWLIGAGSVAAVILLCIVAAITGPGLTPVPESKAGASPSPHRVPSAGASAAESRPTEAAGQPSPSLPADRVYQGRGDKVIKLALPADVLHTATVTHKGSSNFAITTVGSDGEQLDLLVNEIGNYSGVVPVEFGGFEVEKPSALKINADGSWKIVIRPLAKSPVWTGSTSGKGAAVLLVASDAAAGLTTVRITHGGRSNFAVMALGDDSDLLVNEIGKYNGEVLLPAGSVCLVIEADGAWTLTKL